MKNSHLLKFGLALLFSGCSAQLPNLLISTDPVVFTITSPTANITVKGVEKTTDEKLITDAVTYDTWGNQNTNAQKAAPKQGYVYLLIEINVKNTGIKDIDIDYSKFSARTSSERDRNVKKLPMYNEVIMKDGNVYYANLKGLFSTYEPNETGTDVLLTTIENDATTLTLLYGYQILGTIKFK
jgi:hypothetical protein